MVWCDIITVFSSTGPCRHEAEVKHLRKVLDNWDADHQRVPDEVKRLRSTLEWARENGNYADISSRTGPKDDWDDELCRRAGKEE